jgi:hypothetical protein
MRLFKQILLPVMILLIQTTSWATSDDVKPKVKIAFIIEHLLVRGTEVSTLEYADYNEKILGNESYVIFLNDENVQKWFELDHSSDVRETFINRFGNDHFFECKTTDEVNRLFAREQIDIVYWQAAGGIDPRFTQLATKTAIHAVFGFTPQGHAFAAISKWLSRSNPSYPNVAAVPYIVHPPKDTVSDLRNQLGIPQDAVVFGRHGGYHQFNIPYAKEAVIELAQKHPDWYFLFLNTEKFCTLPNVIYCEKTWDFAFKERFINTCDAMLHAREIGETFGLACAEFSIRNKPIITAKVGDLAHIDILGDKALIYTCKEEFINHLEFCAAYRKEVRSMDWDAYSKEYNPEAVMKLFNKVFVLPLMN